MYHVLSYVSVAFAIICHHHLIVILIISSLLYLDETPLEIKLRGPNAIAAYKKASQDGTQEIRSIRLMFVGPERVGKTSLMKALMGKR